MHVWQCIIEIHLKSKIFSPSTWFANWGEVWFCDEVGFWPSNWLESCPWGWFGDIVWIWFSCVFSSWRKLAAIMFWTREFWLFLKEKVENVSCGPLNSSPFLYLVKEVFPWLIELISFPLLPNLFSLLLVFLPFADLVPFVPWVASSGSSNWFAKVGDDWVPIFCSFIDSCCRKNGALPNNGRRRICKKLKKNSVYMGENFHILLHWKWFIIYSFYLSSSCVKDVSMRRKKKMKKRFIIN